MISPINFRASVGNVELSKPVETEAPKTETITNPIETAASFKGANALAAYNKAFLAVDSNSVETEETPKAPAFKGEEVETEETPKAPAFKGEEVETEEAPKAPAFKGKEVESEEAPKAPAFKSEEVETEETPKAPAFKGEEVETDGTQTDADEATVADEKSEV